MRHKKVQKQNWKYIVSFLDKGEGQENFDLFRQRGKTRKHGCKHSQLLVSRWKKLNIIIRKQNHFLWLKTKKSLSHAFKAFSNPVVLQKVNKNWLINSINFDIFCAIYLIYDYMIYFTCLVMKVERKYKD